MAGRRGSGNVTAMRNARWNRWAQVLLLLLATPALGSNGRLLTTDAAEKVDAPVLGLQRSAVPLPAGFALDTSLLADLLLLVNVGVRWSGEADIHRFVVGARYAHFVGTPVYSALLNTQEAQLRRYEPALSGPSFYGVYGAELGPLLLQVEGKVELMDVLTASVTAAAKFQLSEGFALIAEAGYRVSPTVTDPARAPPPLRAAAGLRIGGHKGQITVGAAYVGIDDPMLGTFPVLPVLDLAWSFR